MDASVDPSTLGLKSPCLCRHTPRWSVRLRTDWRCARDGSAQLARRDKAWVRMAGEAKWDAGAVNAALNNILDEDLLKLTSWDDLDAAQKEIERTTFDYSSFLPSDVYMPYPSDAEIRTVYEHHLAPHFGSFGDLEEEAARCGWGKVGSAKELVAKRDAYFGSPLPLRVLSPQNFEQVVISRRVDLLCAFIRSGQGFIMPDLFFFERKGEHGTDKCGSVPRFMSWLDWAEGVRCLYALMPKSFEDTLLDPDFWRWALDGKGGESLVEWVDAGEAIGFDFTKVHHNFCTSCYGPHRCC